MDNLDDNGSIATDLAHLARLALSGRQQDIQLFIRRLMRQYKTSHPATVERLKELLREAPTRSSPLREAPAAPVDQDSRLQLVRHDLAPHVEIEPIFDDQTRLALEQLIAEHTNREHLEQSGLSPTRTALFTGPPGVGKTLAARWVARRLNLPLLTLDLSAVMSSFLGRTGSNLRQVLDYAKTVDNVLLLDELDAIAKRRDDATEVGELKRLVTVLLQEVDDWPPGRLLIAATNHSDLLDPAAWRRFELVVEFPMPDARGLEQAIESFLGPWAKEHASWIHPLSLCLTGASFNDVERELFRARRAAASRGEPLEPHLLSTVRNRLAHLPHSNRVELAAHLVQSEAISQRQANELTGVSRDTIRKVLKQQDNTI